MYLHSGPPVESPQNSTVFSSPFVPQFGFELIALTWRCITLCLSLSHCVCVPCRTYHAFSLLFHSFCPRRSPARPFPSSPCASQHPESFVFPWLTSAPRARVRLY